MAVFYIIRKNPLDLPHIMQKNMYTDMEGGTDYGESVWIRESEL